jgi:D-3-phosphoglycerate dehydrogenase
MKKWEVLFTAEADNDILKQLKPLCNMDFAGWNLNKVVLSEDELIEKLKGKQILALTYEKVTRRVIESSPDLQMIICTRANPINVDAEAVRNREIVFSYTPGRNSDVTAEFAVGLLLDLARNITFANRAIINRSAVTDDLRPPAEKKADVTWGKVKNVHPYSQFKGVQIKNKNIGIIGFGSIGRKVAQIMRGFGAYVLVYDPYISAVDINDSGIRFVDFRTLLKESDFISCHTKITKETTGMFNYAAFQEMKRTAFFINNSRGAIVVEEDLIRALKEHIIGGAALDVFENEPLYAGHPFICETFDNLLITPHISGASDDAITNGTLMMVEEIKHFINDEPVENCVL